MKMGEAAKILPAPSTEQKQAFVDLLAAGKMQFDLPEGFVEQPGNGQASFPWVMALRHESDAFEVRYSILPVAQADIDYEDPHSAAPSPNHLYPMLYQMVADATTAKGVGESSEFGKASLEQIEAQWAKLLVAEPSSVYAPEYAHVAVLAMHSDDRADAFAVFLANDEAILKSRFSEIVTALRYLPSEGSADGESAVSESK